jgi:glycosyltransferase involved in cell wall biosynthesis
MKALWVHNFNQDIKHSGTFMFDFAKKMRDLDVEIDLYYTGNLKSYSQFIKSQHELSNLSKKYDLLHSQFGSACALLTSTMTSPKILSLRGSDWHRYLGKNLHESFHSLLAYTLTNASIRKFDGIIVMSKRMEKELYLKYKNKPIYYLPDPIDLYLFRPLQKKESRQLLFNSNSESPWVLFTTVSKENPIKRSETALKAIQIAKNSIPDIELKIATGISRQDMPHFISACDLALCTSTHEGWPNSIKEAIACNLPFVSTDVSDLALIAGKYHNCKVSPASPEVLAKYICECLMQPKTEIRKEIEHMNMTDTCLNLLSIYKKTLGSI